jgi:parallel beta-helix repeat protein
MKCKLLIAVITATILFGSVAVMPMQSANALPTPSGSIIINGNSDLEAQAYSNGWPGNGTVSNPYIIANLSFDSSYMAILIERTDLSVVIHDCTFTGSYTSIEIDLASNITISGNTINGGYYGIYIYGAGNNVVSGNTIKDAHDGVNLDGSRNNTVANNNITVGQDNGISLTNSDWNMIYKNKIVGAEMWCGVSMTYSDNNTISENTLTGGYNGIYLEYLGRGNIITYNTIDDADSGILIADTPNSNTVANNTITSQTEASGLDSGIIIAILVAVIIVLVGVILFSFRKKK